MSIKSLSLIVFDSEEAGWLVQQACALAATLDAHLTVLHPYNPMLFFDGLGAEPMIYATLQDWEDEEAGKIRAIFDREVRATGILAESRTQSTIYGTEEFLFSGARCADLVLAGTNGALTRSPDDRSLMERVIRNLGRPVLVLCPERPLAMPPKRLVIGWSDTREATRAAHDALALTQPGAEVQLVSVLAGGQHAVPGIDAKAEFAVALDRLGYKVTVTERGPLTENRAGTLTAAAQEFDADLLVAGAFGHSQLYDFVVGAVTRDLLNEAPLPVLLSK